ncbi:hypothetical protein [Prochlorococcus marinus]|uniref:hypothetical protein n=1 Tax=Prochlorococcus marinus TaxID=1219 RepID=UPI0022B4018D|nr:hypothetical protein [Prochlorococcus marinus]
MLRFKVEITFYSHNFNSMAPYRPPSNNPIDSQLSLTPSRKEVPTALSMMVDSMASMAQRAKTDLERVDQRARADLERVDQRARADLERVDQRARADLERVDQRARADLERLDQRARADHQRLKKD